MGGSTSIQVWIVLPEYCEQFSMRGVPKNVLPEHFEFASNRILICSNFNILINNEVTLAYIRKQLFSIYTYYTTKNFKNLNPVWSKFKMFGQYIHLEPPAWRIVHSIRAVHFIHIWNWNPPYIEQLLRFTFFA